MSDPLGALAGPVRDFVGHRRSDGDCQLPVQPRERIRSWSTSLATCGNGLHRCVCQAATALRFCDQRSRAARFNCRSEAARAQRMPSRLLPAAMTRSHPGQIHQPPKLGGDGQRGYGCHRVPAGPGQPGHREPGCVGHHQQQHQPEHSIHPPAARTRRLTIDGIPYSAAPRNTITGAIPGVTLNLAAAAPDSPVQLAVGHRFHSGHTSHQQFRCGLQPGGQRHQPQFTVDTSTNSEGTLASDGALRSLQSEPALRRCLCDFREQRTTSTWPRWASTPTMTARSPSTPVNSTTCCPRIRRQLQNFFQNSSATGFATHFNTDLTSLTDPTAGPLNTDLTQNSAEQQDLTKSITNFETQLTSEQAQLTSNMTR